MPNEVIERVHLLARRSAAENGITFGNRTGVDDPIDIMADDDNDDGSYDPDDDDDDGADDNSTQYDDDDEAPITGVDDNNNNENENLEGKTPFLATVGSVAPFIGLFGTVWGIMNSFTAIANSNNTSLTVVAPGIAEALFATALGLVAAIPAVMAYNKINHMIASYTAKLEAFSEELEAVLSKHLIKHH